MQVKCPTCRKRHVYDVNSPFRPFCSERCKLIDLGQWASGAYKIEGVPGSADPDLLAEQLEKMQQEENAEHNDGRHR